jgi:hypothetical protein
MITQTGLAENQGEYRQVLARARMEQSMSRPDNCFDNSWNSTWNGLPPTIRTVPG